MRGTWILVAVAGLSLGSVLPSTTAWADTKKDEVEVPMAQLPEPVRTTVEREAQGGHVDGVDRLTDDARLFKAEIKKQDSKQLVYIDADGKVIGKHIEKK